MRQESVEVGFCNEADPRAKREALPHCTEARKFIGLRMTSAIPGTFFALFAHFAEGLSPRAIRGCSNASAR